MMKVEHNAEVQPISLYYNNMITHTHSYLQNQIPDNY